MNWLRTAQIPGVHIAMMMSLASADGQAPSANSFREGKVLAAFRSGVPEAVKKAAYRRIRATEVSRTVSQLHVLTVPPGTENSAVRKLRRFSSIRYAELDWQYVATAGAIPNDPGFGQEWGLLNTGQTVIGYHGVAGADINVTPAWSMTTGSPSIVVAVLDTGVQYSHPDLVANMWSNPGAGRPGGISTCPPGIHGYSVLTSSCDPMDDETYWGGHGTFMAGVIGASGNNGRGSAGIAWTTSIMAVKWLASNATGYTSDLVTAMNWVAAAKQAGVNVRVVSESFTSLVFSQALSDAIDLLGANDILVVASAGNATPAVNLDTTPKYPCSYQRPNLICATALDMDNSLWSNSNYSKNVVDVGAPSATAYSTLRQSNYGVLSGSSMAAPFVAGEAALILSKDNLNTAQLRAAIVNNLTPVASLASTIKTGGAVNVCKALSGCATAVTGIPVNVSPPEIAGAGGTSIPTGSIVAASTGVWSGMPTRYSYQWFSCTDALGTNCQAVAGATGQTFGVFGVASSYLRVVVTASNAVGSGAAQPAAASVAVDVPPPAFVVASSIPDGGAVGGTTTWTVTPSQPVYFVEFWTDGVLLQTVSSSPYAIALDATKLAAGSSRLGVRALATDNRTYSYYSATVVNSSGGAPVFQNAQPPCCRPEPGGTLSTSVSFTNSPTSYIYQWQRCDAGGNNCANLAGQTGQTYQVPSTDIGQTIRYVATASNAVGSGSGNSPAIAIVGPPVVTNSSFSAGVVGAGYQTQLTASGGVLLSGQGYGYVVSSGALPSGLAIAVCGAGGLSCIAGTPASAGTFSFSLVASDGLLSSTPAPFSMTISPAPPPTGITLVQSNSSSGAAVNSLSAAFPGPNSTGNLSIVFVRMSSTNQTVNVTDSLGNSYAKAVSQTQTADGHQIHVFYAANIRAGANTVTLTFSAANNHPFAAIFEYAGLRAADPLDKASAAQGSGSAVNTGSTAVTNTANELVFAGTGFPFNYTGTITAGTGYVLLRQDTGTSRSATEAMVATSTGSFSGKFVLSASTNWSAVAATFKTGGATQLAITTASLPSATVGLGYSANAAASGGISPYSWSIVSGGLPAGLSLNPATGAISGTPSSAGSTSFTLQVSDNNAQTASQTFTLTVNPAGANIALIQSAKASGTSVPSLSAAFSNLNTAGNLIVAFARMSSTNQTVTVSDTLGNVYSRAVSQAQTSDGHQIYIFYAKNIRAGANTLSAAFSAVNNHPFIAIYEYSGLSTTAPLDTVAAAQGSSASVNTGSTGSTSSARELVFAGSGFPNNWAGAIAAGSGYTLQQQDAGTSRAATEAAIVSSMASYSGTFGLNASTSWSSVVATFQ